MDHLVGVAIVPGSDPREYYARCEYHQWKSPEATSDESEAARWAQEHRDTVSV